jgi:hypothetical protein
LRGLLGHLADVLIDSDFTYADAKIDSVGFSAVVSRKLFRDKIGPLLSVQKFPISDGHGESSAAR